MGVNKGIWPRYTRGIRNLIGFNGTGPFEPSIVTCAFWNRVLPARLYPGWVRTEISWHDLEQGAGCQPSAKLKWLGVTCAVSLRLDKLARRRHR